VNVSDLGIVTTSGKIAWGRYAQITNNPEVCTSSARQQASGADNGTERWVSERSLACIEEAADG
jgi:hypothetical protein